MSPPPPPPPQMHLCNQSFPPLQGVCDYATYFYTQIKKTCAWKLRRAILGSNNSTIYGLTSCIEKHGLTVSGPQFWRHLLLPCSTMHRQSSQLQIFWKIWALKLCPHVCLIIKNPLLVFHGWSSGTEPNRKQALKSSSQQIQGGY